MRAGPRICRLVLCQNAAVTLGAKSLELIQYGPLVRAEVRHHPLSAAALSKQELADLALWGEPSSNLLTFLVDTGAPQTLIDCQILDGLKIEPIGALTDIATAYGVVRECPTYRVELCMKLDDGDVTLPTTIVGLPPGNLLARARYRGILGRTMLQNARFIYDGAAGTFDIKVVKP
jgi:hypothetical protein